MKLSSLLVFLLPLSFNLYGGDFVPPTQNKLEGHITTTGENALNADVSYTPDTHLIITLDGKAAKQTFDSLKVNALDKPHCPWGEDKECYDRTYKKSSNIKCTKNNIGHLCEIIYDLNAQKFINPDNFSHGGDI